MCIFFSQRGTRFFLSDGKRNLVAKLLRDGKGCRQVARILQVAASSVSRISRWLAENGEVKKRQGFARQVLSDGVESALADLIKSMRQKGISVNNNEIRQIAFKIAHDGAQQGRVRGQLIQKWIEKGEEMASITWLKGFLKRQSRFMGKNPTNQSRENDNDTDELEELSGQSTASLDQQSDHEGVEQIETPTDDEDQPIEGTNAIY